MAKKCIAGILSLLICHFVALSQQPNDWWYKNPDGIDATAYLKEAIAQNNLQKIGFGYALMAKKIDIDDMTKEQTMSYLARSLVYFQKAQDSLSQMLVALDMLHIEIDKTNLSKDKSMSHFEQGLLTCINYFKKKQKALYLANSLQELGRYYLLVGRYREADNFLKEAVIRFKDIEAQQNKLEFYHTLSYLWLVELCQEQHNFTMGELYLKDWLALIKRYKVSDDAMATPFFYMGLFALKQKKYNQALTYLHKAEKLVQPYEGGDQDCICLKKIVGDVSRSLSETYQAVGQINKSLYYAQKASKTYHNLIINTTKGQFVEQIATFEKNTLLLKDLQIKNVETEQLAQNRWAIIFLLIICLGLFIGGFLLYYFKSQVDFRLITEQAKNAQLRGLIEGQEQERQRIAEDLHDGVGNKLLGIKLMTEAKGFGSDKYSKLTKLLEESSQEIRQIAHNLTPQWASKGELHVAIQQLTRLLNESSRLKIEFERIGTPIQIPEFELVSIYRIIQELLTNIVKYTDASEIIIQLTYRKEELKLLIEDNSTPKSPCNNLEGGMGRKNILRRLELLGAELLMDTQNNATIAFLYVPIRKNTDKNMHSYQ